MPGSEMPGRPRLVVAAGGQVLAESPHARGDEIAYVFEQAHTTIGSAPGQDIVLDGLPAEHAVIDYIAEGDEFVFRPLVDDGSATIDGKPIVTGMHHGDRLELGSWTLVFQRDEPHEHIRQEGAREGGEYSGGGITEAGGHQSELGGATAEAGR